MKIIAADVTGYLEQVPAERREALTRLRQMCLDMLEGYEECIEYNMPSYKKDGGGVAFANQKHYISLYIVNEPVLDAHRHLLKGLSVGKCCIRYPKPEKIDFAVVQQLLDATRESDSEVANLP
jgi:uncharacterized protein YdhG (YjbR/CyaY superfamily)